MKYYLIAGEASGDLHASRLMQALREKDGRAEFRYFGGDLMAQQGGTLVKHYRELAYMGFIPVLMHLLTILRNMRQCKEDISRWKPDVVVLVDYPGFNLGIAKYVKAEAVCPVFYYIAPKIWAWKEYRIKSIRRDVTEVFSILPFEVPFFEEKHRFPIHYVGNPTANEVHQFLQEVPIPASPSSSAADFADGADADFLRRNALSERKPIIALLCGSRRQEIRSNLPAMLQVTDDYADRYQIVIAGAPAIDHDYYAQFTTGHRAVVLRAGQTFQLLHNATAALVTSGTATLETCMFDVPQVVCYNTGMKHLFGLLRRLLLKVKYVSLVNLIAGREVVPELVADTFSVNNIRRELQNILSGPARQQMLDGYADVKHALGDNDAADNAATIMTQLLGTPQKLNA